MVPDLLRKQMKIHELACASPDAVIKVVRDFLLKMLFGIAIIRMFGYFGMFSFKSNKILPEKLFAKASHPQAMKTTTLHKGVSKNSGTPKRVIYNGKPYLNGWFGGKPTIFGNTPITTRHWKECSYGLEAKAGCRDETGMPEQCYPKEIWEPTNNGILSLHP